MIISSAANDRVKQVIKWRDKGKERDHDKVYLVEGFKMFEEAPKEEIREVYVSESAVTKLTKEEYRTLDEKLKKLDYVCVTDDVMRKMSDTQTPQGILTVMERKKYSEEIILSAGNPLLLFLENLQDPGNLGTIVRTGEGAGITGILMSAHTVDIYNPKTIRATMGSIYRVPFLYVDDLGKAAEKLTQKGIHSYAAHLAGTEDYDSQPLREPSAFFIGNEGNGLSPELAQKAEKYVKIPMEGKVESLNAAVAASIFMYEAHRQRK